MLGVTAFGIFLTPIFYNVIQWCSEWYAARQTAAEAAAPPARKLAEAAGVVAVRQADHGYMVPEPDLCVRLESLTYVERRPTMI